MQFLKLQFRERAGGGQKNNMKKSEISEQYFVKIVEEEKDLGTVNKLILTIGFDFIIPFPQLFIRKKIDLGKFLIRYFSPSLINMSTS